MKRAVCLILIAALALSFFPLAAAEGGLMLRAAGSFVWARTEDGALWGWGDNTSGQLGDGTNKRHSLPFSEVAVGIDGTHVTDIQGGNISTLFLMDDGTVWTCGRNNYGQQGIPGCPEYIFTPAQIPALKDITKIACGYGQCMALDKDGHIWIWGRNSNGQAGVGNTRPVKEPVMLPLENISEIHCGGKYCLALSSDGTIWGWGDNEYGELLDASKVGKNVLEPTRLSVSGRFMNMWCGGSTVLAMDQEGKLWSWGRNDYWQLGNNTVKGKYSAVPVPVLLDEGLQIASVYAYNTHFAILTEAGALWIWGGAFNGQLGIRKRESRVLPTLCVEQGVRAVAVGSLHTIVCLEDGTVVGAGLDKYGQTGTHHAHRSIVDVFLSTGLNLLTGIWEDPGNG